MSFPSSLDSFTTKTDNVDDVLANDQNEIRTAIEAIETKLGIDSSAVATSIDYLLKNASSIDVGHLHSKLEYLAATGNKLYFYSNTVPTGWTIVAVTDAVLAVKGGSQAYNVTGGQTAGTWTQPDHTLTQSETPVHNHAYYRFIPSSGANSIDLTGSEKYAISYEATVNSGGDGAHNHGTTYRPAACVGVIGAKD